MSDVSCSFCTKSKHVSLMMFDGEALINEYGMDLYCYSMLFTEFNMSRVVTNIHYSIIFSRRQL